MASPSSEKVRSGSCELAIEQPYKPGQDMAQELMTFKESDSQSEGLKLGAGAGTRLSSEKWQVFRQFSL